MLVPEMVSARIHYWYPETELHGRIACPSRLTPPAKGIVLPTAIVVQFGPVTPNGLGGQALHGGPPNVPTVDTTKFAPPVPTGVFSVMIVHVYCRNPKPEL